MAILPGRLIQYEPMNEWDDILAKKKLDQLFTNILLLTDGEIEWYHNCRKSKGALAKTIRVAAIVLFISSTLAPYFSAINGNNIMVLYIGYILAGLGGGLLLFDRYYGLSNSWIRFALTGMELENLRNSFVQNWQLLYFSNQPLTPERFGIMVDALLKFQETFNAAVKAETEQWAREFQQNLKDLAAALKAQSDQLKADVQASKTASVHTETPEAQVPMEVIREAIDRKFSEWKEVFDIVAVAAGKKMTKGEMTDTNCLVFSPVEKVKAGDQYYTPIPPDIRFTSVNGRTYDIPTDVREEGSGIYASSRPKLLCDFTVPKRPGCSVSRKVDISGSGTLGLKVWKEGKTYFLSCYHVLCAPELNDEQFDFSPLNSLGDTTVVSPSVEDGGATGNEPLELGRVTEGCLNGQLDCAIALIENSASVTDRICKIDKPPLLPLTITDDHATHRYPVKSVGRTTGIISGAIQEAAARCEINYWIKGKWKTVSISGLVRTDQLTDGGDSGAPVVDEENNIVGIIIANSASFTYIVPIQRILSKFSVTLNQIQ